MAPLSHTWNSNVAGYNTAYVLGYSLLTATRIQTLVRTTNNTKSTFEIAPNKKYIFSVSFDNNIRGRPDPSLIGLANSRFSINDALGDDYYGYSVGIFDTGAIHHTSNLLYQTQNLYHQELTDFSIHSGEIIDLAVDTVNNLMWVRNQTSNNSQWYGNMEGEVVDPSRGLGGIDISDLFRTALPGSSNLNFYVYMQGYDSNQVTIQQQIPPRIIPHRFTFIPGTTPSSYSHTWDSNLAPYGSAYKFTNNSLTVVHTKSTIYTYTPISTFTIPPNNKFIFSVLFNINSVNYLDEIGLANVNFDFDLANYALGGDGMGYSIGILANGLLYDYNDALNELSPPVLSGFSINSGDIIDLAVDTVNNLMWVRNQTSNNSQWYGNPYYDGNGIINPTTGTGGIDISYLFNTAPPGSNNLIFCVNMNYNDTVTIQRTIDTIPREFTFIPGTAPPVYSYIWNSNLVEYGLSYTLTNFSSTVTGLSTFNSAKPTTLSTFTIPPNSKLIFSVLFNNVVGYQHNSIGLANVNFNANNTYLGSDSNSIAIYDDGTVYDNSSIPTLFNFSINSGDIIDLAVDTENYYIWIRNRRIHSDNVPFWFGHSNECNVNPALGHRGAYLGDSNAGGGIDISYLSTSSLTFGINTWYDPNSTHPAGQVTLMHRIPSDLIPQYYNFVEGYRPLAYFPTATQQSILPIYYTWDSTSNGYGVYYTFANNRNALTVNALETLPEMIYVQPTVLSTFIILENQFNILSVSFDSVANNSTNYEVNGIGLVNFAFNSQHSFSYDTYNSIGIYENGRVLNANKSFFAGGGAFSIRSKDIIDLAVDTTNNLLWIRNQTMNNTVWYGRTGAGNPTDPIHGDGIDISYLINRDASVSLIFAINTIYFINIIYGIYKKFGQVTIKQTMDHLLIPTGYSFNRQA